MEQKTAVAVLPTELLTIDPDTFVDTVYEPFETRLTKALEASKDVAYVITTKEGMEVAKTHRRVFRDIRIELEKKREESKGPIIKIGKLIDSRAKEITAKVTPEEERFDKDIKAEEQRIEDEKAAKIKAEAERNAQIQSAIDAIKNIPLKAIQMNSAQTEEELVALHKIVPSADVYGERFVEAEIAIKASIDQLNLMLEGKKAQEQLAAMQEAQRIEEERLARIAAEEKAKAEAKAREEQAAQAAALKVQQEEIERQRAEMAAQQRAIDEQRAALEAELKAKAEREAAAKLAEETARIRAEEQANVRAEADALASAGVGKNNHQSEAVTHDGARPAAASQTEPAAPVANVVQLPSRHYRPTDDEIIEALALNFRVHESKVIEWLLEVDLKAASERMAQEFA
ncbi:MAG TPA: hypothetical protein VK149_12090 [Sideroxyarcus sp.]|nr:hypothetical protein [Sideroxyarcus sp.]